MSSLCILIKGAMVVDEPVEKWTTTPKTGIYNVVVTLNYVCACAYFSIFLNAS